MIVGVLDDPDQAPYEAGQRWGYPEWELAPATTFQRFGTVLFLAALAFTQANHHLKWGLFGQYGGLAAGGVAIVGGIWLLRTIGSLQRFK